MGNITPRVIRAIFAVSPTPSHRTKSDSRPMMGTNRSIWTLPSIRFSPALDRPAANARSAPSGTPMSRPQKTRCSDAHRAAGSVPLASRCAPVVIDRARWCEILGRDPAEQRGDLPAGRAAARPRSAAAVPDPVGPGGLPSPSPVPVGSRTSAGARHGQRWRTTRDAARPCGRRDAVRDRCGAGSRALHRGDEVVEPRVELLGHVDPRGDLTGGGEQVGQVLLCSLDRARAARRRWSGPLSPPPRPLGPGSTRTVGRGSPRSPLQDGPAGSCTT